ncbi:hypothetical protein ACWOFO_13330 [Carnobacterium maltaromaticum]|nr:hypothetical protein [Carnobacterium maltaromaticum]MBC9789782.1 hypothetical protein [Carnobacterium maltaromaticum]
MQTNYLIVFYAIILYYTTIVSFRVLFPASFLPNLTTFMLFSTTRERNSPKKKSSSKTSQATTSKKKRKVPKKLPPKPKTPLERILFSIKKTGAKLIYYGIPTKKQVLVITIIAFFSYLITFSNETFVITYLYLCVIYLISLIYLAYIDTKEENELLKKQLYQLTKHRKKRVKKRPNTSTEKKRERNL